MSHNEGKSATFPYATRPPAYVSEIDPIRALHTTTGEKTSPYTRPQLRTTFQMEPNSSGRPQPNRVPYSDLQGSRDGPSPSQGRSSSSRGENTYDNVMRSLQQQGIPQFGESPSSRFRPFSKESIRNAVIAHLEITGRHDVVIAMLKDEATSAQRGEEEVRHQLALRMRAAAVETATAFEDPVSKVDDFSVLNSTENRTPFSARAPTGHSGTQSALSTSPRKPNQKRYPKNAFDFFKRGIEELQTEIEQNIPLHVYGTDLRKDNPHVPTKAKPDKKRLFTYGRILPTLCGLPETLFFDLAILYMHFPQRLRRQYDELHLRTPPREVLQYIEEQSKEPMWSVAGSANLLGMPPNVCPQTGDILFGTLHELVEKLTGVSITEEPLPAPDAHAASFVDVFFRQHRCFTTSAALLAKLIERFMVPLALPLGFKKYRAHGIYIDINSDTFPRKRSQCETVSGRPFNPNLGGSVAESMKVGSTLDFMRNMEGEGYLDDFLSSHDDSRVEDSTSHWMSRPPSTEDDAHQDYGNLVTYYSKSASLWLQVCSRIQVKVLAILLHWVRHFPHQFDQTMLRTILHFCDQVCYLPARWTDCPVELPQVGEFLRHEAAKLLNRLEFEEPDQLFRQGSSRVLTPAGQISRRAFVEHTIPPTMSRLHTSFHTWLKAFVEEVSVEHEEHLPPFTFRKRPEIHQGYLGKRVTRSTIDRDALLERSRLSLDLFSHFSMADYVKGLTASHLTLFALFPPNDIVALAKHESPPFFSTDTFKNSFISAFLHSSTDLTEWSTSLLLHAAFVDSMQPPPSTEQSSADSITAFMQTNAELKGAGKKKVFVSVDSDEDASDTSSVEDEAPGNAQQRAHYLVIAVCRIVDLVVAFLQVNNVHASYSIFQCFSHPYVIKLMSCQRVASLIPLTAVHSVRRLQWFFTPMDKASKLKPPFKHFSQSTEGQKAETEDLPFLYRHLHFDSPEYLNHLPDKSEYPLVPVLQPIIKEFQTLDNTVPAFLTSPKSPFHPMAHENTVDAAVPSQRKPAPGPTLQQENDLILIHWRKFAKLDEMVENVRQLQKDAAYYLAARSTLGKTISVDRGFEEGFHSQLNTVIIEDVPTQTFMVKSFFRLLEKRTE
ncbi:RasGEF N-terminal motif containing protein, putative [Angomonas deanei]|uniref:RasGEF N-terminal motif containing protein, putative n=1 Tax=Angomonas deanei TaxID=59799 RepID=A0A7G2CJ11_9TRYP|nr:RasGEF N-terminal motif containing protein, putative [Angomonas deanei]